MMMALSGKIAPNQLNGLTFQRNDDREGRHRIYREGNLKQMSGNDLLWTLSGFIPGLIIGWLAKAIAIKRKVKKLAISPPFP